MLLKSATFRGMNEVAKFPGLMTRKRSRDWYYRAQIPKSLRAKFAKTEIWVSLGTEDRSDAERTWYGVSARIRDELDQVRTGDVGSFPNSWQPCARSTKEYREAIIERGAVKRRDAHVLGLR